MPEAAIGPIIGGVAGLAGSALSGGAASKGAGQSQALEQQQLANLQPFVNTGQTANTAGANLLGINGQDAANAAMANFQQAPGYQFQMQQGLRAIDAGAASTGILRSGATIKAEDTFGTGLADQSFQQYYNNLMGLSQQGVTAATGGASTANNAANLAQSAGNTQGSIYGNVGQGLGQAANTLFPAVGNYLQGQYMGSPLSSTVSNPALQTGGLY